MPPRLPSALKSVLVMVAGVALNCSCSCTLEAARMMLLDGPQVTFHTGIGGSTIIPNKYSMRLHINRLHLIGEDLFRPPWMGGSARRTNMLVLQVDRATPPRTPPRNDAEMAEKEEAGRTSVELDC